MSQQFSLFGDDLEPVPPGTSSEPAHPTLPGLTPPPAPTEPELTPEEKATRLEEVRIPAVVCTRCDLARTRTHVAFGEGNPAAPLVLIGEGPGENEDATGRPFVGRAGKLLDDVLRRNGMNRNHVYICNVIKCRATELDGGRIKNRPPTQEEIDACNPWLQSQLGIIRPLVAICVGAPAANTIIHKGFRMTSERGKWFTTSQYATWTMAVFHPAYVLRLHGPAYDAALETLVEDLGHARQKVIEVKRQLREAREAAEGKNPSEG